jgi:hypothetical protein
MPQHLSETEVDAVLTYCYMVLAVLRLSHYDVILSDTPAEEGTHAGMYPVPGRYVGLLKLPLDWEGKATESKTATLIHECLHLMHGQVSSALSTALEDNTAISHDTYLLVWNAYLNQMEYMVDSLTIVIEEAYDIPWPTADEVAKWKTIRRVTT